MSEHTTACDCTVNVDEADGTVRVELPIETVVEYALTRRRTGPVGGGRCCPCCPAVGCC